MKRNTIQRSLTLEAVKRLANHPTADEVYEEVIKTYPSISKGTVYRNLNQLCDDGLLALKTIPGSSTRFDHMVNDHYHGICSVCGKVFDVEMKAVPDIADDIKDTHGFIIEDYDIIFTGRCQECLKKN
ncbi:MAG: transcriptional repressor [Holdemanella sp.]|nr:transcriptional repressor [Holdemanella sp.]